MSKKRKTVCGVFQFGLSKFCVSDTDALHCVWRQIHAFVILKRKEVKLASFVVLVVFYRKLQTHPVCLVATLR